jgi:hypothetical protein
MDTFTREKIIHKKDIERNLQIKIFEKIKKGFQD